MHTVADPQQLLYVMSDLVRNHVRLRKVARGAESLFHFIVEAQIDVDVLVERTIKRAGRRTLKPTRGSNGLAAEHEGWLPKLVAPLSEPFCPHVFVVGQHRA